ncbi:MAG: alpha/beta hydrolase [Shimia sp.]
MNGPPRIAAIRALVLCLALAGAAVALWRLEGARPDIAAQPITIGATPATLWRQPAPAPVVIVAHGFAGSRPLMNAYSWSLARSGYTVLAYDMLGHGRHPVPMTGDVTEIDGTTARLVAQAQEVWRYAEGLSPTPVAALGHSMATDVLVRAARDRDAGPLILLSAFSGAVTPEHPRSLLLIAGEWEGRLITFGQEAIRQLDPSAQVGDRIARDGVERMALVAPNVEHVGILYSPFALRAAMNWLDEAYDRPDGGEVAVIGPWILLLLAAIVSLWWPLSALIPRRALGGAVPNRAALLAGGWALVVPLLVVWIDTRVLPVLVADYLAMHLPALGAGQIALLWMSGERLPRPRLATLALLAWGLGAFGLALHVYAANFVPTGMRIGIVAALALGAVPFMLADAWLSQGAPLWRRILLRLAFFASLAIAVALDFERLFFLVLIGPVILLFFATYGLMGRWTAKRAGATSAGLALGVILAWALGVTFPLFEA